MSMTSLRMNIRKILVIVFCIGILLCGIGVGIIFMEYSSFEYMGEKNLSGGAVTTETFTKHFSRGDAGDKESWVSVYGLGNGDISLETSKKVAIDKIQFVVEYNQSNVNTIHIDQDDTNERTCYDFYEETGEYYEEPTKSYTEYTISAVEKTDGAIDTLMRYKDEFLENIKQKKFYKYNYECIRSIKVVVNPKNKDLVQIR